MPHEHLSLQCLHGLQRNADHDDDGSTADGQVLHGSHDVPGNDGQQGNDGQIHGAKYHDLVDDLLDEVGSGLAGTEARNEAAVLLQVVGNLHGIVLDGGVEPAEEEDQQEVEDGIGPAIGTPDVGVHPAVQVPAEQGIERSRHGADRLGEDDGHDAGHGHLDGHIGVLTAIDLPANHTLCVLDGNTALGVVDE